MQDYLQGLNENQYKAVTHIDGPLMIVAGAGSGKTKVLTTRIAHLMATGVDAFSILALTFTNKAAAEMKERIEKILGNNEAKNLYIGTFHSVFARILRGEAHRLGFPNSFTIYDSDDSKSVIKTILKEMELDEKFYKPSQVLSRISQAKNALIGPTTYMNDFHIQQEDARANKPAYGKLYKTYVEYCFRNGAMDFDDLLLKMYELLNTCPDVLYKYQNRFKYILIDEYQDTNPVQYEISKILAAIHHNICVVGDDAQSIYSFRGATIENILQFQKDYNQVKVVKLEQNYRSTKNIIHVANTVIKNNTEQIAKDLWTDNEQGEKIKIVRTMTDNEEGKFVANTIQELKLRNHFHNKDIAILYRTNAQSRSFEESLRRMGIAYKIYGGLSFYQRKEIKDFIAYLRVVINPNDGVALQRIINYPARGLGKTTLEKIETFANQNKISFWNALQQTQHLGLRGNTIEIINRFTTMIQYFQSLLEEHNAYEIAKQVGAHSNIVKELFADKTQEGIQRYENIQALLNSIKEWTDTQESLAIIDNEGSISENNNIEQNDISLPTYLQQITLLTDADDNKDEDSDVVKLMTIHAAKGLEFPIVFVAGVEESIFPSGMSINSREELEEERRLFYVAVTRAMQKLWLTYANARYRFGNIEVNAPSRFIKELPKQYIDEAYVGGSYAEQQGWHSRNNTNTSNIEKRYGPPPKKNVLPSQAPPQRKVVEHTPKGNFIATDPNLLKEGSIIEHERFGFGKIIQIDGIAMKKMAVIQFEKNGEKRILLHYAKLRLIE